MQEFSLQFIDAIFKEYYGREYLAVEECRHLKFQERTCVKKIAMQYPRLSMGGVERVISLLTPMFIEMGYEVVFITEEPFNNKEYLMPEGVEIVNIPRKMEVVSSKNYLERAKCIQRIIESKEIDTICYHDASSNLLLYDFLAYKYSGTNFILVKHEYLSGNMAFLGDLLYSQKKVFPMLDKVIVLSNIEKYFWEKMGIHVEYIYNPIGEKETLSVKELCNKKENIILWIGRLDNQKQYLDVVPIMKRVIEKVPDAALRIYGSEGEVGAIEKLNNAIALEHMERNIEYCGYVTQNIAEIYSGAAVHLVTSICESFSMTIYESKVKGIPLVLYQMPYLEILKERKGYIAVENDDIVGAADVIVRILKDDTLRRQLSKEAIESAQIFNNNDLIKRWKEIFESLSVKNNNQLTEEQDNSMKTILDAIIYHHHRGCMYYKERSEEMQDIILCEKLRVIFSMLSKKNELPIVIYPYGKQGKLVKQLLNRTFSIHEAFVVDNNAVQDDLEIKTLEELREIDCSKYLFLICSNSKNYYNEIRNCLRAVVPSENIIDVFPQT